MAVYYCTLRGTLEATTLTEIFQHSIVIQSASSQAVVAQAVADAWDDPWQGAVNGIRPYFSPGVQYTEATAAQILDPSPMRLSAATHVAKTWQPGGGPEPPMPSQCAICVSLTAGTRANGTPLKGRFYLPTPASMAIQATGLMDPSVQQTIAQSMAIFMNTLMQQQHWPSIQSRTEEYLVNYLTGLRVGNKVDTMRSRRNSAPETYATGNILPPG